MEVSRLLASYITRLATLPLHPVVPMFGGLLHLQDSLTGRRLGTTKRNYLLWNQCARGLRRWKFYRYCQGQYSHYRTEDEGCYGHYDWIAFDASVYLMLGWRMFELDLE